MKRNPLRALVLSGLLLMVSGCKYDRSFMQMDSNSGVPFFGLQLAVDSGSRPPRSGTDRTKARTEKMPEPQVENLRIEPFRVPKGVESKSESRLALVSRTNSVGITLDASESPARKSEKSEVRYSLRQQAVEQPSIAQRVARQLAAF